jgi:hypothetical protein
VRNAHSGASAVAFHNHADAAAAIRGLLDEKDDENIVKVELEAGCESLAWRRDHSLVKLVIYRTGCIIFSLQSIRRTLKTKTLNP